jgi:hypothetical protein
MSGLSVVSAGTFCAGAGVLAQCGGGLAYAALGHDAAGTVFAASALGGNAQLHLDVVKTQACACMAVGKNSFVNAINSHLQFKT